MNHTPTLASPTIAAERTADRPKKSEESTGNHRALFVIGFRLSRIILIAITVFVVGFLALTAMQEYTTSYPLRHMPAAKASDSSYTMHMQLIRVLQEQKKNDRDFTMQFAQMILLNLLLPMLMALLGYMFANGKQKE